MLMPEDITLTLHSIEYVNVWINLRRGTFNCAKVYFLSNYYIHKYLMPLYKSLSLFNKRERYMSEGIFWLLKHKAQRIQSHLEVAFEAVLQEADKVVSGATPRMAFI